MTTDEKYQKSITTLSYAAAIFAVAGAFTIACIGLVALADAVSQFRFLWHSIIAIPYLPPPC